MAREEYVADSASSQVFWLLFESDLTPAGKNLLDGRYACFGYTIEVRGVAWRCVVCCVCVWGGGGGGGGGVVVVDLMMDQNVLRCLALCCLLCVCVEWVGDGDGLWVVSGSS